MMARAAETKLLEWGVISPTRGISVAISLFNYERFIEECLESVARQDFADLQLIVVDDCSERDNSLALARAWMGANQHRFPSGVLVQHQENRGLAEARNTAFRLAAADTVFVMDADNLLLPSCLRKLKRALDASDAVAAYSQMVLFDGHTGIGFADYWSKSFLAAGPYIDAMALIRKKAWQLVGGYTDIVGGWEDYDFWCKIFEAGGHAAYVPEMLGKYRVHGASMLRTETTKHYERLRNTISLRHPWVELE